MKVQGECRVCAIPLPYPHEYCSQHPELPIDAADYLAPCYSHRHRDCPGEQRDRGDGLLRVCECRCHTREDDAC